MPALQMVTCSNGGGPDFSGNFFDPAKTPKTITDHIKFARDFILPFGYCNHFKMNNGPRPPGYDVSDDQIKVCADALNAIGKETIKFGIKLAPHPHVGSLIQNEHETRKLMELTDPRYVWLTTDTSHLTLGGMDPLQIIKDYWPRVAEVHYKDAPTPSARQQGRGGAARPAPEAGGHGWFRNLGGDVDRPDSGGVDFPAIQTFLIEKNYKGWVTLDLDASMIPKGSNMEADHQGQHQISGRCPACGSRARSRPGPCWLLALLAVARRARATLTVLAPASAAPGLKALAAQYTRQDRHRGHGRRRQPRPMSSHALKAGAGRCGGAAHQRHDRRCTTVTGMTPLGRIAVGVGVKAGSKVPDISTPEKFRAALLAARGVAYADPGRRHIGRPGDRPHAVGTPEFRAVSSACRCRAWPSRRWPMAAPISPCSCCPNWPTTRMVALAGPVPDMYGAAWIFPSASRGDQQCRGGADFISLHHRSRQCHSLEGQWPDAAVPLIAAALHIFLAGCSEESLMLQHLLALSKAPIWCLNGASQQLETESSWVRSRATTFFSHVKPGDTPYKAGGLRDFFLYRDLGIAGATNGKVIAHLVKANHAAHRRHRLALSRLRFPDRDHDEGLGQVHVRGQGHPGGSRRCGASAPRHGALPVRLFARHGISGDRLARRFRLGRTAPAATDKVPPVTPWK